MALPSEEQPAVSGMDALQQERAKLYQIQADLMKQIEERSKPDPSAFWAAMARGFGNPNTPSFAGGAAGFAGNLQAAQEEERKRAIETAQMRMQLAQSQLAMKRSDVIGQALFGEPSKQEPTVSGAIGSVAQAAGVSPNVAHAMPPDLKKAVMLQWMQGDDKGAIKTMAEFARKNAEIPDELKVLEHTISQFPTEQQPFIRKFYAMSKMFGSQEARLKLVLEIKDKVDQGIMTPEEGNSLINSMNPDILLRNQTTPNYTVPTTTPPAAPNAPAATVAPKTLSPKELASQIESDFGIRLGPLALERTREQQQELLDRFAKGEKNIYKPAAIVEGKNVYHENAIDVPPSVPESYLRARGYYRPDKNDPVHAIPIPSGKPATAVSTTPAIGVNAPVTQPAMQPTKRERELEFQNRKQLQEQRNKAAEEERKKAYASSSEAPQNRNIAAEVSSLVSKSQNMFGVFERPNFGSAIGGAIENALKIGTYNIGMPGIRAAVSKLSARNQEDLDNLQKVGFLAVNSSLALAAAAKGAVSNFERELFQQASFSTHDTPNVLLYKSDLLRARADFAKALWDDFRDFEKVNPSKNFTDYQDSRGKDLVSRYEAQLARIRDHYSR